MKKLFLCLANSKKHGGRCIAGVEVRRSNSDDKKFALVGDNTSPIWIRPVTGSHGPVRESTVEDMNLLDVYEVEITEECPDGYQSENVKFNESSLKKVGSIKKSKKNLNKLNEIEGTDIFGNEAAAVHEDYIANVNHSLVLIKCKNPKIHVLKRYGKEQIKIKFDYVDVSYDLPITDVAFLHDYKQNNDIIAKAKKVYLCISLAVNHNGFHSKLVAGIIFI